MRKSSMGFTICYSFQGKRKVIEHSDDNLTPHDAVCYAFFHSGTVLLERPSGWVGSYSDMTELAERFGITDVMWHQSITQPNLSGDESPRIF